jgi:hypothetical protein
MATDIYQAKYEHLLMDPNQLDASSNPSAKLAEMKQQITLAGDSATTHAYPTGTALATAATGTGDSTVLACFSGAKYFTNDILLRVVTAIGATPTMTYNIFAAPDASTYTAVNRALIATPNTLVATAVTVTTVATAVYRIPASVLIGLRAKNVKVTVSANTNVTYTIDAWDFGGVPL